MRPGLSLLALVALCVGCHDHDHDHHHGTVPAEHADRQSPFDQADDDALTAGQAIYAAQCASCHGDTGAGDGPAAASLDPPATDFTAGHDWTDAYLYWRIADGGAAEPFESSMPAYAASLSEVEIWQVIAAVRHLAGE